MISRKFQRLRKSKYDDNDEYFRNFLRILKANSTNDFRQISRRHRAFNPIPRTIIADGSQVVTDRWKHFPTLSWGGEPPPNPRRSHHLSHQFSLTHAFHSHKAAALLGKIPLTHTHRRRTQFHIIVSPSV